MKYLQISLLFLFGFVLNQNLSAQKEDINLEINSGTTMTDLAEMKTMLLDHGAYFQMKNLKFTDEGTVSSIHVIVNFNDGFKGESQMSNFEDGKTLRIERHYEEGAEKPFCIGKCD